MTRLPCLVLAAAALAADLSAQSNERGAGYNGALANVSPTDLGIKAAREVFARSGVKPQDVGLVITGNMAQASFDAFVLPRHVGLYSGVPIEV